MGESHGLTRSGGRNGGQRHWPDRELLRQHRFHRHQREACGRAGKIQLGLRAPTAGIVLVDGENVYDADAAPSFGFVPQDDIVHPELTVIEAMRFSALLRLPRATPRIEMEKLIAQTLDQLRLSQRANNPITRLSGGQRKRVSVGVELLAKPSILFLDEPTLVLRPWRRWIC